MENKDKEILEIIKKHIGFSNDVFTLKGLSQENANKLRDYFFPEKKLTLREYISKNSFGAYHDFIFTICGVSVKVIGIEEFERVFNKDLLEQYLVIDDNRVSHGDNCENYECKHYLTLEKIK